MTPSDIRAKYAMRNSSVIGVLQFLADDHLHPALKMIVTPLRDAAFEIVDKSTDGPELTVAIRRIVEAKDAFVRHYLVVNNFVLPEVVDVEVYEHSCVNCSDDS